MIWNHRVIRHKHHSDILDETEIHYGVHEVFYNEEDDYRIEGWTENGTSPGGDTLEELREDIQWYLEATQRPVLEIVTCEDGTETLKEIED